MALTKLESSRNRGIISFIKFFCFELPTAISTFRKNLFLPIRFILDAENNSLNFESSNFKKLLKLGS